MIDAKERRVVYTTDVPGAYLNADMDEYIIMCLTGSIVDILCKINPDFKKSIVNQKGKSPIRTTTQSSIWLCSFCFIME